MPYALLRCGALFDALYSPPRPEQAADASCVPKSLSAARSGLGGVNRRVKHKPVHNTARGAWPLGRETI